MSSRSTKKQKLVSSEPSDTLFDPFLGFKPRESFADIPWPEWNDADLNAEVWGEPKQHKASTASKIKEVDVGGQFLRFFEDHASPVLPNEITEYIGSWKRPQEVFPNAALTVYDPENLWFTLKVPSPVGECSFFNRFLNIIPILQYYGEKYLIPVELESSTFAVSNPLEPWRPWHHIYSLNKAGKNSVHKPLYNPYGKYVLRLFYFGCWRKFTIDDRIPCDKYGNCMLPVTQVQGELWPLLLAKGLLKIISLTPSCDMSAIDFPVISCLTACTDIKLTALNKTCEEIWRRILLITPQFSLSEDNLEENTKKETAVAKDSPKSKTARTVQLPAANGQHENFCFLFASLGGFSLESPNLNGQYVMVTMNRVMPLMKAEKREPTKQWKRFRWVDWALEKGIWVDELLLPPYRRLHYITFDENLPTLFAPDPIQESTLYDVTNEVSTNEESNHYLSEENGIPKPEHWLDYSKFYEYLTSLNVLFKPSCFTSNFKVTYAAPPLPNKIKGSAVSGKVTVKGPLQNLYVYSPFLTPTLNEPPLLLCQNAIHSFICFSLWVYPKREKLSMGYLDPKQPDLLKIGHASLVVEDYDWRNMAQGKILAVVKTVGNSATYLNLEPGRHVLKLWLSSDSPYVLNIFSSVEIFVHKGPKIRFYMSNESKRILSYIWDISDAFIELTQNFGREEYRDFLHKFYEALKSGTSKYVDQLIFELDFIELFLDSLVSELRNLITNDEELKIMLGALRSLFLNLRIKCDFPQKPAVSLYSSPSTKKNMKKGGQAEYAVKERTLSEVMRHPWTSKEIQQIVMIQKIFRGYRVRLLLKCQTPLRKEFKFFTEKLKKISDLLFSPSKREAAVGKIIRQVLRLKPELLNIFIFHDEFSQVLHVDEYIGKVPNVEANAWVPLVRFTVALHFDEPEPCAFYLHCNLEQYFLVGVNNDTHEEIFLLSNTLSPHYYKKNVNGYTIFGYGWNGANPRTVNWRLEMVTMKWFQGVHLCNTILGPECHSYTLPTLEMIEIKNFYVPNRMFKICRCFIIVRKKCSLTLRFSSSYPKAKYQLTIFLEGKIKKTMERFSLHTKSAAVCKTSVDTVIRESVSENGSVLIPSLVLDNMEAEVSGEAGEGENSTKYILEAYVIENSWPLTKHEWGVVEPIRMNGEASNQSTSSFLPKKERAESRRKTSRILKRSALPEKNVEAPYWQLQVVNNLADGETEGNVIIGEEKLFFDAMKSMKKFWEEKDPGRKNRGREMRLKFLNNIYLENRTKQSPEIEEALEETLKNYQNSKQFVGSPNIDFFEDMIHKMNSFSYLLRSKSPTRYSRSPKVLPGMPTNELLLKYGQTGKNVPSKGSNMSVYEEVEDNIESEVEEREREFWEERTHYRRVMENHILEVQKLSEQLMEKAYKERLKAIEKMAR